MAEQQPAAATTPDFSAPVGDTPEKKPETAEACSTSQMDSAASDRRWEEKSAENQGLAWLGQWVYSTGRNSPWAGLALVALAFALAAAVSWRKWPDVIVDFGMQLYIPWRICHGAVLYRDLHYLAGGPFSQYFNALLFKIFGVSFRTLIFANLAITAALLVLVYRRFLAATDRWTATTIGLAITLVFAFNEYLAIGNYNYVAPYSHELFHGLAISVLAIALLSDWIIKRQIRYALAAGLCFGLVFLTKPDVFLALAAAALTALILAGRDMRQLTESGPAPRDYLLRVAGHLIAFLAAALVPIMGFFLFFLRAEDWHESVSAVTAAWAPLFTPLVRNRFYLWCTGLDAPFFHIRQMAIQFAVVSLLVALYARLFHRVTGPGTKRTAWLVLVVPLLAAAAWFNWLNSGAALPLWSASACVLLVGNYKKLSAGREMTFPLLWSVFSLALLAKLGLFSRIWHYGFALAMPAAVTAIYLLFWLLPELLEAKFNVAPKPFRLAVWLVLLIGFGVLFHDSRTWYVSKNLVVGRGSDRIYSFDPQFNVDGEAVTQTLKWIEKNVPPDATLAVVPEGAAINYLSRRVNPTPCLDWSPPVLIAYGESRMTAAFERNAPDYICVVTRDTSEFGAGPFGRPSGYGLQLMQWIEGNYRSVYLIGDGPSGNGIFGVEIWKRQTVSADK